MDDWLTGWRRNRVDKDFRTNYSLGGTVEKTEITPEQEELAIASARAVGCNWCGVDIIVEKDNENKPYVLEVNASPGTTGIEKTTNIPVTDMVLDFLLDKKNWVKPKKTAKNQ